MVALIFSVSAVVLFTIGFRLVKRGKTFSRRGGDAYMKRRMRRMLGLMLWTTSAVLVVLAMISAGSSLAPSTMGVAQSGHASEIAHVVIEPPAPHLMPNLLHAPALQFDSAAGGASTNAPAALSAGQNSAIADHAQSLSPSLLSPLPSPAIDRQNPSDSIAARPEADQVLPSATVAQTPPTAPPRNASSAPSPAKQKELDADLTAVNGVLQKDPSNVIAYIQRGNVYGSEKKWDLAKKDYQRALELSGKCAPASFNLAELDFMQGRYDAARPGFLALQQDSDFGDLSKYSVFLCDLFGAHEDVAARELDVFNQVGSEASYYFANVAWSLYHKKDDDARSWMQSAVRIFAPDKVNLYAKPLIDLGYVNEISSD